LGRIQAVLFKVLDFSSRGHGVSSSVSRKKFPSPEHRAQQQQCQIL
jgi:hypothetical protein